ncbi:Pol polyprotein [Schistosoma japonicum]|uniref:Pol polyprotein n=1 Tax=Schistosoma japonicum TaxID=6182 RepID=A0A4Z2D0G2_SCHJA|nr:Pol polyprotein [Schistosoma japonicum]
MKSSSDKCSPRESRHLNYISEFSTDIRHISGANNVVADVLSRIHFLNRIQGINLVELARFQNEDIDFHHELAATTLQLQTKTIRNGRNILICDSSTGTTCPIVRRSYRLIVLDKLHNLSHPGFRATSKLITERFCWQKMNKDIKEWARI